MEASPPAAFVTTRKGRPGRNDRSTNVLCGPDSQTAPAAATHNRPTLILIGWPARVQHLGRVAVRDRNRHVPVAVLVEHDVARSRVRERPRRDRIDTLAAEIELDLRPRHDPRLVGVLGVTLSAMFPNAST